MRTPHANQWYARRPFAAFTEALRPRVISAHARPKRGTPNERWQDSVADDTFPIKASIHYQRRYPVFHGSAAAYIAIVWFLVIVVGLGRALLKA